MLMLSRLSILVLFGAGSVLVACGAAASDPADTNTSWLSSCDSDVDCDAAFECLCNVCTTACVRDADCDGYSATASCNTAPAACGEAVNICLPEESESIADAGSKTLATETDAATAPNETPVGPPSLAAPRVCTGFYYVQNQEELNALAGCTEITEGLNVGFDADLEPLSQLRTIGGWLRIGNDADATQTAVSSLVGLRSLESARGIMLENLGAPDLSGLENLRTVGTDMLVDGGFQIGGAPRLRNLAGLDSLERASSVHLSGLPELESLDGLESLSDLGYLTLRALPALRSTSALSVTQLEGFAIQECASLEVLEAPGLEQLALFTAEANPALSSLPALERLEACGECTFSNNQALEVLSLPRVRQANIYLRVLGNAALSRLELPLLQTAGELTFVNNESLPTLLVNELVEQVEVNQFTKVGGNQGDDTPPRDPCPWTTDYVCDEQSGTGLCAADTDADCDIVPL